MDLEKVQEVKFNRPFCFIHFQLFTTQSRLLTTLKKKALENSVEKEENYHFSNAQFVICKCFQFSHVQKLVIW